MRIDSDGTDRSVGCNNRDVGVVNGIIAELSGCGFLLN